MTDTEMEMLIERVESVFADLSELTDQELRFVAANADISWRVLDVMFVG